MKLRIDRDKLNSVSERRASQVAMKAMASIDHFRKEEQIAGLTCVFLLLTRALNVGQSDLAQISQNILNERHKRNLDLKGVDAYIRNELL